MSAPLTSLWGKAVSTLLGTYGPPKPGNSCFMGFPPNQSNRVMANIILSLPLYFQRGALGAKEILYSEKHIYLITFFSAKKSRRGS